MTKLGIFEILCNIYLFSSSCLCPDLAVSVLYFEKKIGIGCVNISKIHNFITYQITFLMTCQIHWTRPKSNNFSQVNFTFWTMSKTCTVWTVNDVLSRSIPFYWVDPYSISFWGKGMDRLKTSLTVHTVRFTLYVPVQNNLDLFK